MPFIVFQKTFWNCSGVLGRAVARPYRTIGMICRDTQRGVRMSIYKTVLIHFLNVYKIVQFYMFSPKIVQSHRSIAFSLRANAG